MEEKEDIIKLEFNEAKENTLKIYGKLNSTVQKDQRIGEYIHHMGNKVPIISKFFGRILKIDQEEKVLVIEKCKHEMVYRSLCSSCGASVPKAQAYVSIHANITFSEEKTKIEEENLVKKYLESKKLILLLDIDNTILHASNFELTMEEYENLKKKYDQDITLISIPFVQANQPINSQVKYQKIFIKFRPKLKEFLEAIRERFDIFIYTQGTKEYAEEIIKYLNETYEYNYFSTDRMVARTGINWENKSIKRIFPTTEDMVLILDDRMDVWPENLQNLIQIVPYYFFYDERAFKIKTKFKTEDDDMILFCIEKMLLFINQYFYYHLDNFNKKTDVKFILEKKISSILNKKKFTFSGLYSKDIDIYDTRTGYLIDKLGGSLDEEYDDETDIVLTKEFVNTSKIKTASKKGKLILHEAWVEFCSFFFTQIKKDDFILTQKNPRINHERLQLNLQFQDNLEQIIENFSVEEEKLKLFSEFLAQNNSDSD